MALRKTGLVESTVAVWIYLRMESVKNVEVHEHRVLWGFHIIRHVSYKTRLVVS